MLKIVRSYFACLRANVALGRATRLQIQGQKVKALAEARRGLLFLSRPYIARRNVSEGSALLSLTMLVEWLAVEEKESGASNDDLRDALAFIRQLENHPTLDFSEQLAWAPYLESRLAQNQ